MRFLIITHVEHGGTEQYFAYAPYVREMNIWNRFADEIVIIAPHTKIEKSKIHLNYSSSHITFRKIPSINFQTISSIFKSLVLLPVIFYKILKEMRSANHIHLRCPGNIGLVGCVAQIFFPNKRKSAKYAGNWDPKSKQPISYRLQKYILSNTFLTRNIDVLVYGQWTNQSANIKSFFTATYSEIDKLEFAPVKTFDEIKIIFVGTLTIGKRPLYALEIVKKLIDNNFKIIFDIYGDGVLRDQIDNFIANNQLQHHIKLHGNHDELTIRKAYKEANFLILPSKSEGWPKAVAESMFWGVFPIASAVSCVPDMLQNNNRGLLLTMNLETDYANIVELIMNQAEYDQKINAGMLWSRQFTLDLFEKEVRDLLC